MRIAIIGTGLNGLVTAACLAHEGNQVVCVDKHAERIRDLQRGHVDFVEPGLDALVQTCRNHHLLDFVHPLAKAVADADVIFLAADPYLANDKQIDITSLVDQAGQLAFLLRKDSIVVVQSTVPPGTSDKIQNLFDSLSSPRQQRRIQVVYNPVFLTEGHAIASFQSPANVVIGSRHGPTQERMKILYAPFIKTDGALLVMDSRSAEFSKYAHSAILATRISVMNELACIAGQVNVDISAVSQVLAHDNDSVEQNLEAGAGYGGTSLPAHISSLIQIAQTVDEPAYILRSLERVNHRQTRLLFETISAYFSHALRGRCLAVWGLAAIADTDDINQAPSLTLIQALLAAGAQVQAYDPVAASNAERAINNNRLTITGSAQAACNGADALIVMTACQEFLHPDFDSVAQSLSTPALFDARNMYDAHTLQQHQLHHHNLWQKRPAAQANICQKSGPH